MLKALYIIFRPHYAWEVHLLFPPTRGRHNIYPWPPGGGFTIHSNKHNHKLADNISPPIAVSSCNWSHLHAYFTFFNDVLFMHFFPSGWRFLLCSNSPCGKLIKASNLSWKKICDIKLYMYDLKIEAQYSEEQIHFEWSLEDFFYGCQSSQQNVNHFLKRQRGTAGLAF